MGRGKTKFFRKADCDAHAKNSGVARRSPARVFDTGFFSFFCAENSPPGCFRLETLGPELVRERKRSQVRLSTLGHRNRGVPLRKPLCSYGRSATFAAGETRFGSRKRLAMPSRKTTASRDARRLASSTPGFSAFSAPKIAHRAVFGLKPLVPNWFGSEKGRKFGSQH